MSYNNVGKVWTPGTLQSYLKTIKRPAWAKAVCLHHTAEPSLAQRPKGFTIQHIVNIESFYTSLGWKSGPHFFTDEDQVFGMTPPSEKGVHAIPFNSDSIGIEALGYYSKGGENPKSGRGLEVWETTARATKVVLDWLGLPVNEKTVRFHREGKTSKDCPGAQIDKDWVISLINGVKPIAPTISGVIEIAKDKKFTPVAEYLISQKGYSYNDIGKNLRRVGKDYFWIDDHLELAYYDSQQETTVAPLSELESIKNK